MEKTFAPEFYEAGEEIQRFAEAKGIRGARDFLFTFRAFTAARKCTKDYVKAVNTGVTDTPCFCGYHPSRRSLKMLITEETAAEDLKNITNKFGIAGGDNETRRILLQVLETARKQLKENKLLRESYIDSAIRSEVLPVLALDVVKYLRAGEMTVKQADNALIEIKGRYETLFREMRIKPDKTSVHTRN